MACSKESGTCPTCVSACRRKPGWFMPGEIERVAEHLGLPLEDLFRTKLAVDWWEGSAELEETTFVIAPALVGEDPGEEYPGDPEGQCVFLDADNRCSIHAVKPFECSQSWCGEGAVGRGRHLVVAKAWVSNQEQVEKLLGREPEASSYDGGGLLGLLGF